LSTRLVQYCSRGKHEIHRRGNGRIVCEKRGQKHLSSLAGKGRRALHRVSSPFNWAGSVLYIATGSRRRDEGSIPAALQSASFVDRDISVGLQTYAARPRSGVYMDRACDGISMMSTTANSAGGNSPCPSTSSYQTTTMRKSHLSYFFPNPVPSSSRPSLLCLHRIPLTYIAS
jgi:hypothetical protein